MAKFRTLFENQGLKDLTHEVMTAHGMKPAKPNVFGDMGHHYEGSWDSPEKTEVHDLHKSLSSIGWKEKSYRSKKSDDDLTGSSTTEYSHPDMKKTRLHITHDWTHGYDHNTGEVPSSFATATYEDR